MPPCGSRLRVERIGRGLSLSFTRTTASRKQGSKNPSSSRWRWSPIKSGETIALRNIFFETASYDLLPASNAELGKVVKLMQANPSFKVEVGGHTDNVGDEADNQTLSEHRANAVRDHLIAAGIDGARMTAKGYGGVQARRIQRYRRREGAEPPHGDHGAVNDHQV